VRLEYVMRHLAARPEQQGLDGMFLARGSKRAMQVIAGLLVLNAVVGPATYYALAGTVALSPALLGGLVGMLVLILLSRERVGIAVLTFIWSSALIPIWGLTRGYGLMDANLLFLPVAAAGTGFLLGWRHAGLVALVASAAVAAVLWMELAGVGFPNPPADTRVSHAVSAWVAVVLGAVIGAWSTMAYREKYAQVLALSRDLEANVKARTAELEDALRKLAWTQEELVESGTLASLGSLVAGVSHELNTPIGNALMASTTALDVSDRLRSAIRSGTLRRSEFESMLDGFCEANRLCSVSISRTAELVASFKQVAVDRVSERRREFSLGELVDDTLATLRPGTRHRAWVLSASVSPSLVLDGYPGPLGQVLTNVVQNALVHGFDGREQGRVHVSAAADGDWVEIDIVDDGQGMPQETLARIFEPFFTTRLGRGGSGLGLSISRQLVTRVLGGAMSAESTPGAGSRFRLRLPRVAPVDALTARGTAPLETPLARSSAP